MTVILGENREIAWDQLAHKCTFKLITLNEKGSQCNDTNIGCQG